MLIRAAAQLKTVMQPSIAQIQIDATGTTLQLQTSEKVFRPSVASTAILFSVKKGDIKGARVFEVGIGTGYIGLGLLKRGAKYLVGSDISTAAVELASHNASLNHLQSAVSFFEGNIFSPKRNDIDDRKYDLIVSNPPLMPKALERFEYGPTTTTDGGRAGDEFVVNILSLAPRYLTPEGVVYVPCFSYSNPDEVKRVAAQRFGEVDVVARHDVIFDFKKLASWETFQAIFDTSCGYEVRHSGHPYWRIEILRVSKPRAA